MKYTDNNERSQPRRGGSSLAPGVSPGLEANEEGALKGMRVKLRRASCFPQDRFHCGDKVGAIPFVIGAVSLYGSA